MALPKLFNLITWHNNTTPAINEDNLNAMSNAIDDIDDRVIGLAGTIMEDVPQIQEDIEELEEDFALIDEKIADATSEANRATTKANEAAASVISAGNKALISEGYAKGTQNGTPVGSSSPYYHNNAEYFKEQARSFTPTGYQDLVDDVAEAQEAITDIEGEKVSSNDAYVLRQSKGNMVDMSLVGGSVAWNQLVQNGNFADASGWNVNVASTVISASNNELSITASAQNGGIFQRISQAISGHKYLQSIDVKNTKALRVGYGNSAISITDSHTSFTNVSSVFNSENTNGVFLVYSEAGSSENTIVVKNANLIDLTQMFGSTIADYIYSLEQATAGAGVAWFRQYFRNLYYGYDAGSIQSVNPSSRKVVGKNLLPLRNAVPRTLNGVTFNVNNDGSVTANGTATATTDFYVYSGGSPNYLATDLGSIKDGCILTGCPSGGSDSKYQLIAASNTGRYATDSGSGATLDISSSENAIRVLIRVYNGYTCNNLVFKPMIRLADTDATYEPYKEYSYPFDTSFQLRGIPKLVDNKLSYDGDIYTADGTVTRKYGIIDLGTLDWVYLDTFFYANAPSDSGAIIAGGINAICAKYSRVTTVSDFNSKDKVIVVNATAFNGSVKRINIHDSAYSDAATFKTAMSGVYLVYELATPTTETATPYQNPQRAFIDGTEEFVDYGVRSATRDVSIPVGNESEYNTSEVLPISQDYTDGAMEILKEIVASSSDFADFKTKVAAL